jgi:hypothetical protein
MAIPLYLPLEQEQGPDAVATHPGVEKDHVTDTDAVSTALPPVVCEVPPASSMSEGEAAQPPPVAGRSASDSPGLESSVRSGRGSGTAVSLAEKRSPALAPGGGSVAVRSGRGSGTAPAASSPLTGSTGAVSFTGKRSNSYHDLAAAATEAGSSIDRDALGAAVAGVGGASPMSTPLLPPARAGVPSISAISLPPQPGLSSFLQLNSEWPAYAAGAVDAPAALSAYQPAIDGLSLLPQYAAPHMKLRVVSGA